MSHLDRLKISAGVRPRPLVIAAAISVTISLTEIHGPLASRSVERFPEITPFCGDRESARAAYAHQG